MNEVFAIVNEGKNPVSNREISRLGHKNMNRQEMLTHLTEHYQWTPVLYFHKKRRGHEPLRFIINLFLLFYSEKALSKINPSLFFSPELIIELFTS